jgi:telomere length regulation protein
LAAGCLQRLDSCAVKDAGRSSIFLNTVSNRLAASSSKARFLGMIIGTAISQLIEEPGKAMKFDLEEMESDEAVSYLDLVKKTDRVGSLDYIKISKEQTPNEPRSPAQRPSSSRTEGVRASNAQSVKIVSIEEIGDSENDENEEDDDLIPYEKPDDDPSDSDDDPTLVNRNKPTPPV